MSAVEQIENVVLGGGEAGKYIAWELAKQGRATMVIERELVGGSCPNIACLPSRNVIRIAKVADLVHQSAEYGIKATPATTDMLGVRRRKREMIDGLIEIHRKRRCCVACGHHSVMMKYCSRRNDFGRKRSTELPFSA